MKVTWACYGGDELINSHRLGAYIACGAPGAAALGACRPTLHECGCVADVDEFDAVGLTDAPWWDGADPASTEFYGLHVYAVEGLRVAPWVSNVSELASGGGRVGGARLGVRPLTFKAILHASTCRGMAWGLHWLTSMLTGKRCGAGACGGADLTLRTCCPELGEPDDAGVWTLRGVVLTDAPTEAVSVTDSCGCKLAEVSWEMTATDPWVYGATVELCQLEGLDAGECGLNPEIGGVCVDPTHVDCPPVGSAVCPSSCGQSAPPPDLLISDPCAAIPASVHDVVCCLVEPPSLWRDGVLTFRVEAGSALLPMLQVDIYPNPLGRPGPDLDPVGWSCVPSCARLLVRDVCAFSTLEVDGVARRAMLEVGGQMVQGRDRIGLVGGVGWSWSALEVGCSPVSVCVKASDGVAADARVSVLFTERRLVV